MINVTDPAAVRSLLQNAADRSRRLTEATDQFFLENSAIIFLYHHKFFKTLRPFIKILPAFGNILLSCLSVQ